MCKLCGNRHNRYEPHTFSDPIIKLMFESEPRWPIENELGLPERYPRAVPDPPRSNAPSPSHRTPDTEPLPNKATELRHSEPAFSSNPGKPDTAPSQSSLEPEPRPKFDRKTYQREYMRRRRAAQKDQP
jgi:hypothetical protein